MAYLTPGHGNGTGQGTSSPPVPSCPPTTRDMSRFVPICPGRNRAGFRDADRGKTLPPMAAIQARERHRSAVEASRQNEFNTNRGNEYGT